MLGLAPVEKLNLGLSAGAVAASWALATPQFALGLAAGALLEAVNLGAIHRGARRLFLGEVAGARSWVGVFSLRFVLLAVAIYATLQAGVDPVGLLVGLSIAMPATLIDAWVHRPPVLDPATLPVLLEDEQESDDSDGWDDWSIWRPGRLITTQRDDLLSEASARDAGADAAITNPERPRASSVDPPDERAPS